MPGSRGLCTVVFTAVRNALLARMVNSGRWDGYAVPESVTEMIAWLEEQGRGKAEPCIGTDGRLASGSA